MSYQQFYILHYIITRLQMTIREDISFANVYFIHPDTSDVLAQIYIAHISLTC